MTDFSPICMPPVYCMLIFVLVEYFCYFEVNQNPTFSQPLSLLFLTAYPCLRINPAVMSPHSFHEITYHYYTLPFYLLYYQGYFFPKSIFSFCGIVFITCIYCSMTTLLLLAGVISTCNILCGIVQSFALLMLHLSVIPHQPQLYPPVLFHYK